MTHTHLPNPTTSLKQGAGPSKGAERMAKSTGVGGALEHAPEDFARVWGEYAAAGELLPRPEGSALLEFVTAAGTPLYLLDRSGPYLPTGPCHMLLHALADPRATRVLAPNQATAKAQAAATPWLEATARSQVRGVGRVLARGRRVLVLETGGAESSVPLLLSAPTLPPYPRGAWLPVGEVGQWLEFATLPPLHGFYVVRGGAARLPSQHHDE